MEWHLGGLEASLQNYSCHFCAEMLEIKAPHLPAN